MSLTLTLTLQARGPAAAFVLTDDQAESIGEGRKAFPVRVDVAGTTLQLRLARMGGENLIGFAKAAREKAALTIGESYEVTITADAADRAVEIPEDLAAALADDKAAKSAFEALAPSHRKEFARWITEAKRPTTRTQRVTKTLEMLHAGEHR